MHCYEKGQALFNLEVCFSAQMQMIPVLESVRWRSQATVEKLQICDILKTGCWETRSVQLWPTESGFSLGSFCFHRTLNSCHLVRTQRSDASDSLFLCISLSFYFFLALFLLIFLSFLAHSASPQAKSWSLIASFFPFSSLDSFLLYTLLNFCQKFLVLELPGRGGKKPCSGLYMGATGKWMCWTNR